MARVDRIYIELNARELLDIVTNHLVVWVMDDLSVAIGGKAVNGNGKQVARLDSSRVAAQAGNLRIQDLTGPEVDRLVQICIER